VPTIVLIRHAQGSYGTADYDVLSSRGERQADAAARELTRRGLDVQRILSGSLRRQRDTAAPAAAALGLPVVIDSRFDEYDMDEILAHHTSARARTNASPDAEPVSSAELQKILEPGMASWIAAGEDSPAAEPWPRFQARTEAALNDLADELSPGTAALVSTSAGVIAALCCAILRLPASALIPLNRVSVNGGMTKLASGRSGLSFISFNEHAYLEQGDSALITLR